MSFLWISVHSLVFEKISRGVAKKYVIDSDLVKSSEYIRAVRYANLDEVDSFISASKLIRHNDSQHVFYTVNDFTEIVDKVGKNKMSLQRFKGLGEMNYDQLWETTLDPESRCLLKVEIKDCEEADAVFSELMGEDVEPRKRFIVDNAFKVSDIDV